jgi:hypothetical protein
MFESVWSWSTYHWFLFVAHSNFSNAYSKKQANDIFKLREKLYARSHSLKSAQLQQKKVIISNLSDFKSFV